MLSRNQPIIVFRADGNRQKGLGHLFRTFSLIEMLKDDFRIELATREDSNLSIIPDVYKKALLPTDSIEDELAWIFRRYCSKLTIIVLDGYSFDEEYVKRLKEKGFRVVFVDDFAREHMYADVVVNHSLSVKEEDYEKEDYTKLALGTKYAMLRPMFLEEAKKEVVPLQNKKVFVCFGGSDFADITRRIVRLLLKIEEVEDISVVLGSSYAFDFDISSPKIKVYRSLSEKEMVSLMQQHDRMVVPTSTVLYESLCFKKYILTGYYVDNQAFGYEGVKKSGAVIGVDYFQDTDDVYLLTKLKELVLTSEQSLLECQKQLIDGDSNIRIKNIFLDLAGQ